MRRFIFLALLAVLLCTACGAQASAVPSNPFSSFGLFYDYVTDGRIKLKEDGRSDYSDVKCFVADGMRFGGMVKSNYVGSGDFPIGTLTVLEGDSYRKGQHYKLIPLNYDSSGTYYGSNYPYAGEFITYTTSNYETVTGSLRGYRVMWNLLTSSDIIAGGSMLNHNSDMKQLTISDGTIKGYPSSAAVIRRPEELEAIKLGRDAIVPFISVTPDEKDLPRYDLCFVRSGDWNTPVAVNLPSVTVSVGNNNFYYRSETYTDFTKSYPVRRTVLNDTGYDSICVSYTKDNITYYWTFIDEGTRWLYSDWGELALSEQPVKMKTGTTKNISIKLPAALQLSDDFADDGRKREILSAGDPSIFEIDYDTLKFSQGIEWNKDKSILTFTLNAGKPGRSLLIIDIPHRRKYYREINVTDENGKLDIPKGTPKFRASQITYRTKARYVEGRPYYPTVANDGLSFGAVDSETSRPAKAYMGVKNDDSHIIYALSFDVENSSRYKFTGEGVSFREKYGGGEYASDRVSVNDVKDIESIDVWFEFPDNLEMNLASAPASSLVHMDGIRTETQQLADFVPYFEIRHSSLDMSPTSIDWSFVKVNSNGTTTKVNPSGISELEIYDEPVEGTEGSVNYRYSTIYFSYMYQGVRYYWTFDTMDSSNSDNYNISFILSSYVFRGESKTATVHLYSTKNLDNLNVVLRDSDIVSISSSYFSSKDIIATANDFYSGDVSFDVNGLKNGYTSMSLIWKKISADSNYDMYTRTTNTLEVIEKPSISRSGFNLEITKDYGTHPVIEGKAFYANSYRAGMTPYGVSGRLVRAENMTYIAYNENSENLGAMLYVSGDTEEYSYKLNPEISSTYDEDDTRYVTLYYDLSMYSLNGKRIRWEFSGDINIAGSCDVPEIYPIQPSEVKPYIQLNRNGANAESLEWYFVDSQDNKVDTPNNVTGISVDVNTDYYSTTFSDYAKKGSIDVRIPEIFINGIYFSMKQDGIINTWTFSPVDKTSNEDGYGSDAYCNVSMDKENGQLPILLYVGESKDVILSAGSGSRDFKPMIGNTAIAGMEVLSSTDRSISVRLSGKSAGMTSLTLAHRSFYIDREGKPIYEEVAMSIDVAIYDDDGNFLGYETRIRSDDVPVYDEDGNFTGYEKKVRYEQRLVGYEPVTYYGSYLSTWPREIWVATKNSTTGKYEIPGLTKDAEAFMNALGSDGKDPAGGWTYSGEASADQGSSGQVTPGGSSSSTDKKPTYDESQKSVGINGLSVYPRFAVPKNPSADAYNAVWDAMDAAGMSYGIDMFDENNMTIIASRDAVKVWNAKKDELLSRDIPQLVAIVLPTMRINMTGFYAFRLPTDNIKGSNQAIFWNAQISPDKSSSDNMPIFTAREEAQYVFVDDKGNPTGAVDGDRFVTVGAYLVQGTYSPYVTAAANSNDMWILRGIDPNPPVPPTSPDVTPTPSGDITPTPSRDITPTPSRDITPTPSRDITPTPSRDITPTPSGDITPDTGRVIPKSAQPDKPGIDVENNPAHASIARNAVRGNDPTIPANVDVKTLPDNASSQSRNVSDLPAEQRAAIAAQSRDVVATLPVMSVDTAAVYTFGVTLDNVTPYTPIYLSMTVTPITAGFASAANGEYTSYKFLDDNGYTTTVLPASQHVNVAAYMEPGNTYSPAITKDSSSSGSSAGDEGGESGESDTGTGPISSSGGGCESGLGLAGMAMLAALFISKRRK